MNWKVLAAGAAGAFAMRQAVNHLHHTHPALAGKIAQAAGHLRVGGELLGALDISRPGSALTVLAKILEGRAVANKDGATALEAPPALFAALQEDGWSICEKIKDDVEWNSLFHRAWDMMHNHVGLQHYTAKRYFGSYWLIHRRGEAPLAGWICQSDDDPLRAASMRPTLSIEATWICAVVRYNSQRHSQTSLAPYDLSKEEIHELSWDRDHGRRIARVIKYDSNGKLMANWLIDDSTHKPYTFIGIESAFKARWTRMIKERRRHNVMIFGPPGCGKTTLMRSWFEEERLRVIEINASDLKEAGNEVHQLLALMPDILLIEDFDRLGEQESGQLMWLFEHSAQDIVSKDPFAHPLMIFATSNHPAKIADAYWRPGRFDDIIEVKKPPQERWSSLIAEIGARYGVDTHRLTPEQMERCMDILTRLSVAHLEQYLQRLAADRDYLDLPSDKTFDPPVRWQG